MGMAASQARLLSITARKSSNEFSGQQINQQRVTLSNNANAIWTNMLTIQVPTPPSSQDYKKTVYKFETQDGADAAIKKFIKINEPGPYGYYVEYEKPKKVSILSNLGLSTNNIKIQVNSKATSHACIRVQNNWNILSAIDKNSILDNDIKTSLNTAQYVYMYTLQDDNGNYINYYLGSDKELTNYTITEKENGLDYTYPIYFKDSNNILNKIESQKLKAVIEQEENSNLSLVIDEETGETVDLEYVEPDNIPETMQEAAKNKYVYRYTQENNTNGNSIYKYIIYNDKLSSKNIEQSAYGSKLDVEKWELTDSFLDETEIKRQKANIKMSGNGQIEEIFLADGTNYKLTIEEALDNDAYDEAMVKYNYQKDLYDKELNDMNARIKLIQAKDQLLEVRLKNIDTEHKALETEVESIKKVLDKNIEASFKTFA